MEKHISPKLIYIDLCTCCGKNLKSEWNFCPFCNTTIQTIKCSSCGKDIKYNWNYCPYCKKKILEDHKNKERIDKCNEWLRDILKK